MSVGADTLRIRTRLEGARQTRAELLATAAAIKTVGTESLLTAGKTDVATRSSFLYRQGLYTLRRGLYATTLTLGGLGTAALTMGIRFDASMEQNRISLTYFLGSTKAANRELASLYQLAATTPFEFGQVTDAARRFLAFGFTLRQTNDYLRILGDTAAGLGLGGEDVDRLAIILGQIKSSGRLLGQDTLQLAQAGINARGILQKQLNLSPSQMLALGQGTLQIPSDVALPALMAGLRERFRGMAALQATTGVGLWSTTKDYARQFFGTLTGSLFERGKSNLKSLNVVLQEMTSTLAPKALGGKGGSFTDALMVLDRGVGANGRIIEAWRELRAVGQDLYAIVRGLSPAAAALWAVFGLGSPPMKAMIGLLGFLARHTTLLTIVLGLFAARLVYVKSVMLAWKVAEALTGVNLLVFTGLAKDASVGLRLLALRMYASEIGMLALGRATKMLTAATWLWNAALALNPVVLITTAVLALAAAIWLAIHRWDQFKDVFGVHPGGAFGNPFGKGGIFSGDSKLIPHLAGGGDVLQTGLVVAHRGETVLPAVAKVQPLNRGAGFDYPLLVQAIREAMLQLRIEAADVTLNERKIGEASFRWKSDIQAAQ